MSRAVDAIFKDGEIRPLEPLNLPDETRLKIIIDDVAVENGDASRTSQADSLARIYEIAEDIGPADLASNLDHYLYGLPKRQ